MKKLNTMEWVAIILVIVGALNWLLLALFSFDLVAFIFGSMTILTRIIYTLVGLSAIYLLSFAGRLVKK